MPDSTTLNYLDVSTYKGERFGSLEDGFHTVAESAGISELLSFEADVVAAETRDDISTMGTNGSKHVVNMVPLNQARYCNKLLESINERLPVGGYLVGCAETSQQRVARIAERLPTWFASIIRLLDFLVHRVTPKLSLTRGLYFAITKGRYRVYSRAEILGRIAACGFDIVDHKDVSGRMYFVARKSGAPAYDLKASYGPIFKMRRIGQDKRVIHVYKMRTMHPFAEYLQAYIYEKNKLDDNGKIKDDYRIASWGRLMRKLFIDEIPMLINLVKGEMKLVGVRPISEHYLTLYPEDLAETRTQFKPGLIPPFYMDLPKNFDEIVASERRYLEAYENSPLKTDIRYFLAALYNILVKRARSQ